MEWCNVQRACHALATHLRISPTLPGWACALLQDDSAAGHLIAALAGVVAATLASVSLAVPFACSGLLELALNCIARPSRQAATEQVRLGAWGVCGVCSAMGIRLPCPRSQPRGGTAQHAQLECSSS